MMRCPICGNEVYEYTRDEEGDIKTFRCHYCGAWEE